jgi:hypothetical protein
MGTDTKQIFCMNWGTKYGPRFINRLYAMVARNITPPFTFTCFTDQSEGIRPEVLCEPLPPLDAPLPTGTLGIWSKVRMYGRELGPLTGTVLYLDLDLVITGSLDDLFTYGDPHRVVMARNPVRPLERLGQSSVVRFRVGSLAPLQDRYLADPQGTADTFRFEQRFMTRNAPGGVDFFPRKWIRLFRSDCLPPFPLNYFVAPWLSADARIVMFPGGLLPEHAIEGRFQDIEKQPPLQHIAAAFRARRPHSHLQRFMKPAPWVADHWRE